MSIKENIMSQIKDAMRAKDADRLSTLRFIHAALKNKEIEIRPKELTDEDTMAALKKMAKQRQDSIKQYKDANREDLASKEEYELVILQEFLPEALSKEATEEIIKKVVAEVGAESMKDMGKVMKGVMDASKGAADNKIVSEIVRSLLG